MVEIRDPAAGRRLIFVVIGDVVYIRWAVVVYVRWAIAESSCGLEGWIARSRRRRRWRR
jgi:hypothetical protein